MSPASAILSERFPRRLSAILCADTAGYTSLMSADEGGTHTAYKQRLEQIVTPMVAAHNGRVVKSTGDGFVAVFDSVTDSLAGAYAIQSALAARNADGEPGRALAMRMGINLGDVIVEDDDVYGHGVNVAARLQTLAEPGAVCVAGPVRDEARGKLRIEFRRLGRKKLRNLSDPVEVYSFRPAPAGGGRPAFARPGRPRRWRLAAAVATGAVLIAAAAVALDLPALWPGFRTALAPEAAPRSLELPGKPSVAVLAFENQGHDAGDDYFADGIAEDIITDLSQQNALFVIARDSGFHYKDSRKPLKQIAAELGVRYILQGSVRHDGSRIRVNVNLMDAITGANVWSERYDRQASDLFQIQADISQRIVAALSTALLVETLPANGRGTTDFSAHDLFLKGSAQLRQAVPEATAQAVTLLKAALTIDPAYSQAHAALAAAYLQAFEMRWHTHLGLGSAFTAKGLAANEVKLAMASPSALAYRVRAEFNYGEGRYALATDDLAEALTRDPNDAAAFALLGKIYLRTGRPADATMPLRVAMRLDPNQPLHEAVAGIAELALGRFADAARLLEHAFERSPRDHMHLPYLAAAYGYLDRKDRADAIVATMNALRARDALPIYTRFDAAKSLYYDDNCDLYRLREGLRRAEVAEGQEPEPAIDGRGCPAL